MAVESTTLDDIRKLISELKEEIVNQLTTRLVAAKQVRTTKLSEISERLGLVSSGEFRAGNGKEPGSGFSGVRMGFPAFQYTDDFWNFVGIEDDILQFGLNSTNGKAYFAGGKASIGADGITISSNSDSTSYFNFSTTAGLGVWRLFLDGAGNIQFDVTDGTAAHAFTFNDGNVIIGHPTNTDSFLDFHENFTRKSALWWDADVKNFVLQNYTDSGNVILAVTGNSVLQRFTMLNTGTLAAVARWFISGVSFLREVSVTPTITDHVVGSDTGAYTYIKGGNYVIAYNDGGTWRYKYLPLTGTGINWVHTTTAP